MPDRQDIKNDTFIRNALISFTKSHENKPKDRKTIYHQEYLYGFFNWVRIIIIQNMIKRSDKLVDKFETSIKGRNSNATNSDKNK